MCLCIHTSVLNNMTDHDVIRIEICGMTKTWTSPHQSNFFSLVQSLEPEPPGGTFINYFNFFTTHGKFGRAVERLTGSAQCCRTGTRPGWIPRTAHPGRSVFRRMTSLYRTSLVICNAVKMSYNVGQRVRRKSDIMMVLGDGQEEAENY